MADGQSRATAPMISPGKLYRGIAVSRDEFEKGETRLMKPKQNRFVEFCKKIHASFPAAGGNQQFSQKMRDSVDFLGWDLKPEEFFAARNVTGVLAVSAAVLAGILVFFMLQSYLGKIMPDSGVAFFYILAPALLGALVVIRLVQDYPLNAAKDEQIKALTFVPEIVGYMIMSMKLVPNLEKAVEFAAEHGSGKIADDFKKVIWDVQLGVYNTLSEGLDAMAYRWGKFSEELKRALMMIRASVLEDTEAKRYALLDKTMSEMLDSIKNKMETYARGLSQPSTILFYIGVLLPLILVIILPVGSAFTGAPLARPELLFFIYNIAIPLGTFIFAREVIKQRPPTYEPPIIPDNFPGLPPKNTMKIGKNFVNLYLVIAIVIVCGLLASLFFHGFGLLYVRSTIERGQFDPILPFLKPDQTIEDVLLRQSLDQGYFEKDNALYKSLVAQNPSKSPEEIEKLLASEKQIFLLKPGNDVTPYNLAMGLMLTGALAIFVYLYYSSIYKRKAQLEIMQMESEFKDSLYIIASRLGENKPIEEAIRHTRDFLPDTLISKRVFSQTVDNISLLGLSLEPAIFDKNFGSLRNIPSKIIQSSMKIVVGSVQLGVNVAARTLVSLSLQLNNAEKVGKMLTILVSDISQMMFSMSIFIAPVVLGITTSLQKVVMVTLSNIMQQQTISQVSEMTDNLANVPVAGGIGNITKSLGSLTGGDPTVLLEMVNPLQFLIIISVYVIELVIIMNFFTSRMEEDNPLKTRISLSYYLPIALAIYFISAIVSNMMVAVFV